MKRNIIVLSLISFLLLSVLVYFFIEVIYKEVLLLQENSVQSSIVSDIDIMSPEIKAAFMKSDDISLLYNIEKIGKIKNVKEAFIIDSNLNVLIHNDSSKWNKKYNDDFYKNLVTLKNKSLQNLQNNLYVYAIPLNESSVLCVNFSFEKIYNDFNRWKIKLYVYGFILSFILLFIVYYLSKFLFLYPFNRTKKHLSLNETSKKTIYSDIVNMALSCRNLTKENISENYSQDLKKLVNVIFKTYLNLSDDIFVILDNKANLIYCIDEDKIVLQNQETGSHIVKLTKNSQLLKNVSDVLENPVQVINTDISGYKINITPLRDEEDVFVAIIISGNIRKDTL